MGKKALYLPMENKDTSSSVELHEFPFVPIEIDGSVYKIHPVVSQLINSLTEQVRELVEINFPDFDESQKN